MGVDARMYIPSNKIYSEDELTHLSYRLGEAVGHQVFMLFSDKYKVLETETEYIPEQFSEYNQVINVNLMGRYYGEGYERGSLWDYIAVAVWIEKNLNITPYYGGDCNDTFELFDIQKRDELINHWAKVGGIPYKSAFHSIGANDNPRPTCPRCKVAANQYGFGGNYAAWSCLGCGIKWEWRGEEVRQLKPNEKDNFGL